MLSVKLLLGRDDVEVDSRDAYSGRTPLSYAAAKGYEAVVRLLVERDDAEADSKDRDRQTPLYYAAARGYEAVVRLWAMQQTIFLLPRLLCQFGRGDAHRLFHKFCLSSA